MNTRFSLFVICMFLFSSCVRTTKVNEPVSKLCDVFLKNCNSDQFKGYSLATTAAVVIQGINSPRQNLYNTDNSSLVDSTKFTINDILTCDSVKYSFHAIQSKSEIYSSHINNITYYFESNTSEDGAAIMDGLKARLIKIYNATDDAAAIHADQLDMLKKQAGEIPFEILISPTFDFIIARKSDTELMFDAYFK